MKYNPLYKPQQIICGDGDTVVVTGWTPKDIVAKKLDSSWFAAIGNLYSPTRGISYLIRNLLANSHASRILIISATKEDLNAGACECLYNFFTAGFTAGRTDTGKPCWIVKSKITGYIDYEISAESLQLLRDSISSIYIEKLGVLQNYKSLGFFPSPKIRLEPVVFPESKSLPKILGGTRYGHRIEGKTIAETWVKILHRIKTTGTIRPTGYDGNWQELIDLVAVVADEPLGCYFPTPNYLPVDRDFIANYRQQILEDAPYQEGVKYTYGQRLRSWFGIDQIQQVINKLSNEIDAASAVMSLWDVKDHEKGGSPCLNHIWLRVVEKELSLTATFRSNDMFGAWVANAMGLRALQEYICNAVGNLKLGPLITVSQSAHIYDDCWESVEYLLDTKYREITGKPEYSDPAGNFIISWDAGSIVVEQTSRQGELVARYCGKNAANICYEIAAAVPHLETRHALYLGVELQKAALLKENYRQDYAAPNSSQ